MRNGRVGNCLYLVLLFLVALVLLKQGGGWRALLPLAAVLAIAALAMTVGAAVLLCTRRFAAADEANDDDAPAAAAAEAVVVVNPLNLRLMLEDRDFDEDDYDALLALDAVAVQMDALAGRTQPAAARPSDLRMLPVHSFVAAADGGGGGDGGAKETCPICLDAFAAGDAVKTTPCLHQFHSECIDRWLLQKAECPVCKTSVFGRRR